MASIVGYWRLPEEDGRFLDYLEKTGDVVACSARGVHDPLLLSPRPVREYVEREDPECLLMAPREYMDRAPITSCLHKGCLTYGRSYLDSPLLDFCRGRFLESGTLEQSNLCFESTILVSDGVNRDLDHLEPQPAGFVAWARKVQRWVRRNTRQFGYYRTYRATARVVAAVEDGLELFPSPGPPET